MTGIIALVLAGAGTGCLVKDTTHTLYLSPEGAVTWLALERDVRSDEPNARSRQEEEQRFFEAVATGSHPVAAALWVLRPQTVRTQLVRGQRPSMVATEADFVNIAELFERIVGELGLPGSVSLERHANRRVLNVTIDASPGEQESVDDQDRVGALLEDVADYRIVLTHGRFVDATGFQISEDATLAVPIEVSERDLAAAGWRITLSLTWTAADVTPGAG